MLRENKALVSLNLETNFITGVGVQALVDALRDNDTLTEIKIDNQVAPRHFNARSIALLICCEGFCIVHKMHGNHKPSKPLKGSVIVPRR